jgi:hypothetical protein
MPISHSVEPGVTRSFGVLRCGPRPAVYNVYRVGHKFVHSFCRRRRRPIGGQVGAAISLGACLGYVGDIHIDYTAVALSARILQAIQENIQN